MGFCQNCGRPLAAGAAFCTHCGAAAAPRAGQAEPGGEKKAAGPGKVLLVVGGVLLLAGVFAVGGLFYAGQQLKQKVENAAGAAPAPAYRARRADACSLLPVAEAARVTGFQVDRAEGSGDVCRYFGTAGRAAGEGRAQAEDAMRRMRANEPKSDAESARAMEDFMKGLAAAGASGQSAEVLRVTVKYGDEAQQEESAVRMALGLMGATPGAKGSQLEGVGDRAYLLPMAVGLHMAKGDAYVMIEGPAAPGREVLIAAAKAIAGKL